LPTPPAIVVHPLLAVLERPPPTKLQAPDAVLFCPPAIVECVPVATLYLPPDTVVQGADAELP